MANPRGRPKGYTTDGLVHMWVHVFDEFGDIVMQGEIVGRSPLGYILQTYALSGGKAADCQILSVDTVRLRTKIYMTYEELNDAMAKWKKEDLPKVVTRQLQARKAAQAAQQLSRPPQHPPRAELH